MSSEMSREGVRRRPRMVVGITGATGTVYGVRLLEALSDLDIESHLVVSKAGSLTREYETEYSQHDITKRADVTYRHGDVAAPIASGSFRTMGMIVAPCSIRTMSDIAHGITGDLISRAADVCLKERRPLVLLVRETPLHAGHLKSMLAISEMGGIIAPPVPAFYTKPETVEDIVDHTIGRALDLFGLDMSELKRWGGDTAWS
ncbi:MAG: UbiX family flavin prenyltransferase [Actinobacteria bacterium]|nr:UbiX family flavin prenyltransferase [Actinomycetota bacterium]